MKTHIKVSGFLLSVVMVVGTLYAYSFGYISQGFGGLVGLLFLASAFFFALIPSAK